MLVCSSNDTTVAIYPSGLSKTTPPASRSIPYASCVFLELSKYTRPMGSPCENSSDASVADEVTIVRNLMVNRAEKICFAKLLSLSMSDLK